MQALTDEQLDRLSGEVGAAVEALDDGSRQPAMALLSEQIPNLIAGYKRLRRHADLAAVLYAWHCGCLHVTAEEARVRVGCGATKWVQAHRAIVARGEALVDGKANVALDTGG